MNSLRSDGYVPGALIGVLLVMVGLVDFGVRMIPQRLLLRPPERVPCAIFLRDCAIFPRDQSSAKSAQSGSLESAIVQRMNFLAHLWLAGSDDGLRLGALLGDFVRGGMDDSDLPENVQKGIQLHRFIDQHLDAMPEMVDLRQTFKKPFRRYAGIILDVAFDHQLARRWSEYSALTLEQFDTELRVLLAAYDELLPEDLKGFMRYADRHGLFASYRDKKEILFSLSGIGRRFSRSNPLHRVGEIWDEHEGDFELGFEQIFPQIRQAVADWLVASEEPSQLS